ncbi:hypothetical protein F-liban_273 [Faustovirus]|nr:hypothetical protein F-liban_273 [Faustovirus]SME64951.1 Hypothetical protein FSTVST1_264 [Faustovirus ST1]
MRKSKRNSKHKSNRIKKRSHQRRSIKRNSKRDSKRNSKQHTQNRKSLRKKSNVKQPLVWKEKVKHMVYKHEADHDNHNHTSAMPHRYSDNNSPKSLKSKVNRILKSDSGRVRMLRKFT